MELMCLRARSVHFMIIKLFFSFHFHLIYVIDGDIMLFQDIHTHIYIYIIQQVELKIFFRLIQKMISNNDAFILAMVHSFPFYMRNRNDTYMALFCWEGVSTLADARISTFTHERNQFTFLHYHNLISSSISLIYKI